VYISLSAHGKELVANAPAVAQGLLTRGLEVLGARDVAKIANSLEQLVTILGAQELPPQLFLSSDINESRQHKRARTRNFTSTT
jgi:hypothetical protein